MSLYVAAKDLVKISDDVFRDMADGRIDNQALRDQLLKASRDLLASSQNIYNLVLNSEI